MLFFVSREDLNYDEHDAFVIRANSEKEALEIAKRQETNLSGGEILSAEVIEISGESKIILERKGINDG